MRTIELGNSASYGSDFYGWSLEQASLLRAGRLSEADIENIAEEIESMGKSQKSELINRLAVILAHLLKWQVQPNRRGNSWRLTLAEQRERVVDHLADNPSLSHLLPEIMEKAYKYGRKQALAETGFSETMFPPLCGWSIEQVLSADFLPDNTNLLGE